MLAECNLQEIARLLPAAPSSSSAVTPRPLLPSCSDVIAISGLFTTAAAAALLVVVAIERRRASSRRRWGSAPLHPSYSSSSVAATAVNITAADVVSSLVFVVTASVRSVALDGRSSGAGGAVVNSNADRGHNVVATVMHLDGGAGGGSCTERDKDNHDADGNCHCHPRCHSPWAATAVTMMTIAGKRGGKTTVRRL